MVYVCEGVVRYSIGWVKMETLLCVVACFNNMKIMCCWAAPIWTVGLCISPCELIYVISICE